MTKMLTPYQKELSDAIVELQRFETSAGTLSDLKAVVVEVRSALTKVQGEILASAFKQPQASETFGFFIKLFVDAMNSCNTVALLCDYPNMNPKSLATFLYTNGNFAGIESFLRAGEQQK